MFEKFLFRSLAAVAAVMLLISAAQAATIDTVPVGNPGNTGEWSGASYGGYGPDRICGAVDYAYNIGTYEVTAGQYRDFLNAVDPNGTNGDSLYNSSMDSNLYGCQITWNSSSSIYDFSGRPSGTEADWVDRPVNYVSWYDAAMFANYLTSGNVNDGAYNTSTGDPVYWGDWDASKYTGITDHDSAAMDTLVATYGTVYVIPTEDEWYKAAYHQNDGVTGNYFDYPTSSNSTPGRDMTETTNPGNNANYYDSGFLIGSPYYRAEVAEFELSDSPYGTFDQGGNLWEWNEAILYGSHRGVRGGSFCYPGYHLQASYRLYNDPPYEYFNIGFRVASIPEPASITLLVCGLVGALIWWRLRR